MSLSSKIVLSVVQNAQLLQKWLFDLISRLATAEASVSDHEARITTLEAGGGGGADVATFAHWLCEEIDSTYALVDSRGVYHLDPFIGATPPTITTGPNGTANTARSFNGTNNGFMSKAHEVDANFISRLRGNLKMSFSIYPNSIGTAQTIFHLAASTSDSDNVNAVVIVNLQADGTILMFWEGQSGANILMASLTALTAGQWYDIETRRYFDKSGLYICAIYINGVLDRELNGFGRPVGGVDGYDRLSVGFHASQYFADGNGVWFNGKLSNIRLATLDGEGNEI